MGQPREIMDRITAAVMAGDREALAQLYAEHAVCETPDGPVEGQAAVLDFMLGFQRAFPDARWESRTAVEFGDTAIDEGYFVGTHSGILDTPQGEVEPTGRTVRLRDCDIITVRDGRCVSHRFYYDRTDFLSQLGLGDAQAVDVPGQRDSTPRTSAPAV